MAEVRFEATVVDVREEQRINGRQRFQLLLDRTAFCLGDRGRLEATGRSGAKLVATVLAVLCDGEGELWHTVEKPLAAETAVTGFVERIG